MATAALSTKSVGSIVKIKISGTLRDFIVVHQGKPSNIYDESCNGTWLLMKDIYENRQWHSSNVNDYASSTIHSYLNSTFLNLIDANIRNQIKQAKIPYRPGSGTSMTVNSGANGLSAKVFLLSDIEMGGEPSWSYLPKDGAKLAYFELGTGTSANNKRIAYLNGSAAHWWSRSPDTNGSTYSWLCGSNGNCYSTNHCTDSYGIRPAFILPSSLLVSDDGAVNTNTAPTTPGGITVPDSINGGDTITISWTASTDAENNLEGYIAERSTDGGSAWSQIYQGSATSTTNTVAAGTTSVMYRVKAYDTQGVSSGYRTSGSVTVVNNAAPSTPASITVPNEVNGGNNLSVTWGASSDPDGNLEGYILERQVDSGDWTEVYRGTNLSYTDTITRGWATVAYRVRAYDDRNAYSGYAESPTRTVVNNTAPVISCTSTSGSDLGLKDGAFTVTYSVGDADTDEVTVTESVDGATLRTFKATLGANNTLTVDGDAFMRLLNGQHILSISATDGRATTIHTLVFSKEITAASITLDTPMDADDQITLCVISVIGSIPQDAEFKVEVTNNAKDDTPVWEDCTLEARNGANYVFTNHTAANGFSFNFRVTASRGESGQGGNIVSIQGGFQ
jgi:hypothetical protein